MRRRSGLPESDRIRDGVLFVSGKNLVPFFFMLPALRSVATYVSVALYVLLAGPPFLLIALVFGKRALLYRVGHLGVRLGLGLSGIKVVVEGTQHIQRRRAAVYAVNHASNVEP